jgi:hypothetical protein
MIETIKIVPTTCIQRTTCIRRMDGLVSAEIDGEIVILGVARGRYYGLDEIGAEIWRRIEAPISVETLCDDLAVLFSAQPDEILNDVIELLTQLQAEDVVEIIS